MVIMILSGNGRPKTSVQINRKNATFNTLRCIYGARCHITLLGQEEHLQFRTRPYSSGIIRRSNSFTAKYVHVSLNHVYIIHLSPVQVFKFNLLSPGMRFPTMCHFDICQTLTSLCSLLLSLETQNGVQSVALGPVTL